MPALLARFAADEAREKAYTPDRPRWVRGNQEFGVSNALAWQCQGFIEDRDGSLRPQSDEEPVFCVGCHGGIGATTDSNFSFVRKLAYGRLDYFSDKASKSQRGAGMSGMAPYENHSAEVSRMVEDYSGYFQHITH